METLKDQILDVINPALQLSQTADILFFQRDIEWEGWTIRLVITEHNVEYILLAGLEELVRMQTLDLFVGQLNKLVKLK